MVNNFTQLGVVSRLMQNRGAQVDLFAIGANGHLYTSWKQPGEDYSGSHKDAEWKDHQHPACGPFVQGTNIAVVSRRAFNLDVFAVGSDGHCYRNAWSGESWKNRDGSFWEDMGGKFEPGTPVVAICRSPNHVDVLAIGEGELWVTHFYRNDPCAKWVSLGCPAGSAPLTSATYLAGAAVGERDYHVFIAGEKNNEVWGRRWVALQEPWTRITSPQGVVDAHSPIAPPGAALVPIKSRYGHCDLFTVFNNGEAFVSWTMDTAYPGAPATWHAFDSQGGSLQPGSAVTAAREIDSVDDSTIRLVGIRNDSTVVTTTTTPHQRAAPREWTEIGAKGQFPPGTKIEIITFGVAKPYLYGVAYDGKILTAELCFGKCGEWKAIGGSGKIKFCPAISGPAVARPLHDGQTPLIEIHRDGSGFPKLTAYRVALRHCVDPDLQQEFSGTRYTTDSHGWVMCEVPVLNRDKGGALGPNDSSHVLEVKVVCEGGQSANFFTTVSDE